MKLNKKHYTFFFLLVASAITFFYLFKNEDIKIFDFKWKSQYEGDNCIGFVSYKIENKSKVVLFPKVHIRAQYVIHSGKRSSVKIVGEKTTVLEVSPNKVLEIEERLELERTPNMVLVNAL